MTTLKGKSSLMKTVMGALLAVTVLATAGPAWADPPHRGPDWDDRGWHDNDRRDHGWHDRGWHDHEMWAYRWHHAYPRARIVYAPPVVVNRPSPVYYYQPAPVYYEPPPPSGISLIFPLNFD